MKILSLGFIFDADLEHVLLVHKNRPDWQAGKVNGVGGKAEPGESTLDCMVRECQEETTLTIPDANWTHFADITDDDGMNPDAQIAVYAAKYEGAQVDASKNDHEEIEWFPTQRLPENVIPNLHFLVPMARQKLLGHDSKEVLIKY